VADANLKRPRFVIADKLVSASFEQHRIIMLGDIGFWADHFEDLQQWCKETGARIEGMTVNIPDDRTLTAFCLRWS
jgi:hypothetical protein